ncbi:glycoside hydrolase family 3 N-terminal domain-containing protein [Ligilactobacillus ruminis]|uniref:glycoside hydrolase family 3 N-terminal domain-containing protein n=1 Tax=Ligilactobacillus ruminis TaxID=1623 RepID=UPI003F94F76C
MFALLMLFSGCSAPKSVHEKKRHLKHSAPDQAEIKLKSMNQTQKIKQMFIVRPQNQSASQTGGVILFSQDMNDPRALISSLQNAAPTPLLAGIDQEGGTVSRLSANPALTNNRAFPSPKEVFMQKGLKGTADEASQVAKILHSLGFNWNLAPVADVSQKQNVAACLKHFPGYGSAGDTHTGFAEEDHMDLKPFKAGIKNGADTVLVAHVVIKSVDPQLPASLSPKIHALLRKKLGFKGVIVTDDLAMGAIRQFAENQRICPEVLAVKAGNDLIMSENVDAGAAAIEQAIKDKQISQKQINRSVLRILKLKEKLGLLK